MIALIIQGNTLSECIDKYIEQYYDYFDEIIISSYKSDYLESVSHRNLSKLKILYNDTTISASYYNTSNMYLQAYTTLHGLKTTTCDFCVKVRGDEFYSNLNTIKWDYDKLNINNVFVSPNMKFQISDHMIGIARDTLIKVFSNIMINCIYNEYVNHIPLDSPEQIICMEYFNIINADVSLSWQNILIKYINLIYMEDLEPFRIAFNGANEVYNTPIEYYNSRYVKYNYIRGYIKKPLSKNVVFITHATLTETHAYNSLKSLLYADALIDTLFIYNTHEHKISNTYIIDIINSFGGVNKIVVIPYDSKSLKTLVYDIYNITSFLTEYPLGAGFTLWLKSDYVISNSFVSSWNARFILPDSIWSLPIYNAKEKCSYDEIFELAKLSEFVPSNSTIFYRGGDNIQLPRHEVTVSGYADTDSHIRFVSHHVMNDYNVLVVDNDMHVKMRNVLIELDKTKTWGGAERMFFILRDCRIKFIEDIDSFAIHMYHSIISENRQSDRDDYRKCVIGEQY